MKKEDKNKKMEVLNDLDDFDPFDRFDEKLKIIFNLPGIKNIEDDANDNKE